MEKNLKHRQLVADKASEQYAQQVKGISNLHNIGYKYHLRISAIPTLIRASAVAFPFVMLRFCTFCCSGKRGESASWIPIQVGCSLSLKPSGSCRGKDDPSTRNGRRLCVIDRRISTSQRRCIIVALQGNFPQEEWVSCHCHIGKAQHVGPDEVVWVICDLFPHSAKSARF